MISTCKFLPEFLNTHITQILSACSTAQTPVFTCICDTKYFWNIKTFVVVQESYQ